MYSVSPAFLETIKGAAYRPRIYGTVAGEGFTDKNILAGSFSITNQCSDNTSVKIGQVYIGELNITVHGIAFTRYTLDGLEVIPYYSLYAGGAYEDVPLGRYWIGSANHTAAGVVIKAYDAMKFLDKKFTAKVAAGTPYQLAKQACDVCGLSLATTQAEFTTFANGSQVLTMYQDGTDISTWRDFISWVAQAAGCIVTADRFGRIVFKEYGRTPVDTLEINQRFTGGSFSDYRTRYTGLYCTNIADSVVQYYAGDVDDGLTYSLGANPFLQYGTEEAKTAIRRAVLNSLQNINYVPFKLQLADSPLYDVADVLTIPGGIADADALFCITKWVWTWHDCLEIEGVGEDPALASAQSKTDKNIAGLMARANQDTMYYYNYANTAALHLSDGETQDILTIDLASVRDTKVDFHAEIITTVDTTEEYTEIEDAGQYTERDAEIHFRYYMDGVEIVDYYPVDTHTDGAQLLHLMYHWDMSANVKTEFKVEATAKGGSYDIPAGCLRSYFAGYGLIGDEDPEDLTKFTDTVPALNFEDALHRYGDAVDAITIVPAASGQADAIHALHFVDALAAGFSDATETMLGITGTPYYTACLVNSTVPVNGQKWQADTDLQYLETMDIYDAECFTAHGGGALSYQVSFDAGNTWGAWNGETFTADTEMTYTDISAVQTWPSPVAFKITFDAGETLESFTIPGGHLRNVPAGLSLFFGDGQIGETWTVTDGGAETYTGTVDDTLVAAVRLNGYGVSYDITCGQYLRAQVKTDYLNDPESYEISMEPARLRLEFYDSMEGETWTVTDGDAEIYTGTVPETLSTSVELLQLGTPYTITCSRWSGTVTATEHGGSLTAYIGPNVRRTITSGGRFTYKGVDFNLYGYTLTAWFYGNDTGNVLNDEINPGGFTLENDRTATPACGIYTAVLGAQKTFTITAHARASVGGQMGYGTAAGSLPTYSNTGANRSSYSNISIPAGSDGRWSYTVPAGQRFYFCDWASLSADNDIYITAIQIA